MTEKLVLTPFNNAIESLHRAMVDYQHSANDEYMRDACIKRFEYTYELSHKMLKRHLEITAPSPAQIDGMVFQDLVRLGYEKEVLKNSWDVWKTYRENRNKTAHGYNEDNAIAIVAGLQKFYDEVIHLRDVLQDYHG